MVVAHEFSKCLAPQPTGLRSVGVRMAVCPASALWQQRLGFCVGEARGEADESMVKASITVSVVKRLRSEACCL